MNGQRVARLVVGVLVSATVSLIDLGTPSVNAATFVVNDTRDRVDSRPGNGVCRTSDGRCTLRAAVQEANASAGADVITLRAGTYMLTRAPVNDNDATTGDLDITGPLTINGVGALTIVDGGTPPAGSPPDRTALDRLFEVHPNAGHVTLSAMTIREGWEAKEGGAILTRTTGTVRLVDVDVLRSVAGTAGGGIYYDGYAGGTLVIERSTIAGNSTNGEGGGVFMTSGRLTVSGTALDRGSISGNSARNGGGVYNAGALTQNSRRSRVEVSLTTVSGNAALQDGGGIDNGLEGELSLSDATVSANRAGGDGGGVASVFKTNLTATRATITANTAESNGGGVYTRSDGAVSIAGSMFSGNRSGGVLADGGGDGGGGLAVYGAGPVNIAGATFTANTASGDGGGLAIHSDGPVDVVDTTVTGNASAASGGGILASGRVVNFTRLVVTGNTALEAGGGIDNQGSGEFAIVDSTVASNTAAEGGGLANRADSTLRVSGSALWGNIATATGGGFLHQSDAATEIENSTLSGNVAGFNGGGLYLDADAGLDVANNTITRNTAPYGSGVGTPDAVDNFPIVSHPLLVFRNTIVAGNVGGPDCHAAFGSAGGNLDGGRSCNFGGPRDRSNANPGLGLLVDNGGPTLTHALTASSAAVGGGVEPCPVNDQRGIQREPDRPCDAGAYEFAGTPEAPPPGETRPETMLDSGPSDTTASTEATFAFSSDDTAASFECSLDGAVEACVSPVHYTDLPTGTHTFDVRAVDVAGVADPTPVSFSWVIETPPDGTPPETTIDSGPDAATESRAATFTFSANEADASFECSLDGVSFATCVSPAEYSGLLAGGHTFAVRATDTASNQDPTAAAWSWTVTPPLDLTAPDTTFDAAPEASTESVDATFRFAANEPGSTFMCALDGPSFNACGSPVVLTGLSVGTHTFDVRATDPAGNVESEPAHHAWTIVEPPDRTPPETTLASGPSSPTESRSAQFTFSASESGATFECALDGAAFATCTSPAEYTGLSAADHTFEVWAIDLAGNADPTPESFTWTIEAPAPPAPAIEIAISSGPPSPTESTSARFTFSANVSASFACSLDGAEFAACTSPVDVADLATGEHAFEVQATDAAGNSDTARYEWTIEAPPACGSPATLLADADAWVDENSTSTNKGDDSILKISSKAPHDDFRALVRFPLPASIPAGCRIASATMSLYAASSTPDRTLEAFRLAGSWTENGVTWSNQPAPTGDAAVVTSERGYRDWDVTAHVQAMYDGGANHGFLIRDAEISGGGFEQQFHGREKGENPPTLIITFAPSD